MPDRDDAGDVLILGAGAAGMMAARELSKTRRVIVLEARDRVGGRLHTIRRPGRPPVELGPEFVHGHMPETFGLLGESGLVAYDLADSFQTVRGGKLVDQDAAWAKADALMERLDGLRHDVSFGDFLATRRRLTPEVRKVATDFVEGFNAADSRLISCRSLALAAKEEASVPDGEKQYRLVGGYDQLANALARSIVKPSRVELNARVRRIVWRKHHVEAVVDHAGVERRFAARQCVIALPLGVMQSEAIAFEPELPTRAAMRDGLIMGPVVKVSVRFRSAFWESLGHKALSFIHADDVPFPTWWTALPLRTPALTGWSGGPAAERVMAGGDVTRQAVASLAAIFDVSERRIARELEQLDTHDWQRDEFSGGAYSYARAGFADLPERLTRPIAGTLFVAGEHTHGGLLGTVAGALHSGARVADQIRRAR